MHDYLVYDIEIAKGILGRGETKENDIEYCGGWEDHKGMGVGSVCAYDSRSNRYRIFCEDNFNVLRDVMAQPDTIKVGFNNIPLPKARAGTVPTRRRISSASAMAHCLIITSTTCG